MTDSATPKRILELARWAPSGDNTQPWRFEIAAHNHIVVHGFDTRAHCVYDLDGHASQVSIGALLETIALAATRFGLHADVRRREESFEERPVFDVLLRRRDELSEDKLVAYIRKRCVQRRALSTQALSEPQVDALSRSVAPRFELVWFKRWSERAKMALLYFANAKLRLTLPEAYAVHRDVIDWGACTSEDKIPDRALGASAFSLMMMRWAMRSWSRIDALNRYAAGTLAPRIELDLIPGLACGAHCVLIARNAPREIDDYIAVGRALQRFWLTATGLGLQFQPQYTPLVFSRYAREGVAFSHREEAIQKARVIGRRLEKLLGGDVAPRAVFMGRIGAGKSAAARSVRLPLERLMLV